jgi:hypothetical protein
MEIGLRQFLLFISFSLSRPFFILFFELQHRSMGSECATMSLFGTVDTQLIIHEHKEFVFFESRKGEEAQASSMLRLSAVVQARNINFDFNRSRLSLSLSGGL